MGRDVPPFTDKNTMHHKDLNVYLLHFSLTFIPPNVFPYTHSQSVTSGIQKRTSTDFYQLLQHLFLHAWSLSLYPLLWMNSLSKLSCSMGSQYPVPAPLSKDLSPMISLVFSLYITSIPSQLDQSHHHTHSCYFLIEKVPFLGSLYSASYYPIWSKNIQKVK